MTWHGNSSVPVSYVFDESGGEGGRSARDMEYGHPQVG
jgi:hypothetical protein